jgi:hypothetical protein
VWSRITLACLLSTACGRIDFDARGDGGTGTDGDAASGAAPRFVQATPTASTLQGSATSASVTFATPPTAGNTIIVFAAAYADGLTMAGPTATSDDHGNSYTAAIAYSSPAGTCGSTGMSLAAIYYASGIASSGTPFTVTFTPTGDPATINVVAVEYAELAAASVDRTASQATLSATSPHMFDSGTTAQTTSDTELLTSVAVPCSGYPGSVAFTDTAGFTQRGLAIMTASYQPMLAGDKIVHAAGMYRDAWTLTYGGQDSNEFGVIATFE